MTRYIDFVKAGWGRRWLINGESSLVAYGRAFRWMECRGDMVCELLDDCLGPKGSLKGPGDLYESV